MCSDRSALESGCSLPSCSGVWVLGRNGRSSPGCGREAFPPAGNTTAPCQRTHLVPASLHDSPSPSCSCVYRRAHTQRKPDTWQFVFPLLGKKGGKQIFLQVHLTQLYLIRLPHVSTDSQSKVTPFPRDPLKWLSCSPEICSAYFSRRVK